MAETDPEIDPEIDWTGLRAEAEQARLRAYAPYSAYGVGAAALAEDGRLVTGCNVENAAYGVGLCAECGLVSQLHLTGGGRLTRFVCVGGRVGAEAELVMPCGRCRQLLWENGGASLLLLTPAGERSMSEVLPDAFGADDLA
ncbi:cytidine deaminase [Nocardioides acrostichi]|uniref:Cytidine deaminase n=1 Tax=Nocardioides acrostichi TaxID=2784339 RepID=A0A930UVT5_9ACTN|nr:cytidine deaminase [Nocardioides acrostichi]MBF4161788.1 cytidine deaminase [Nocardioides acrostichi]